MATVDIVTDDKRVPPILDGKYFEIIKQYKGKVTAKCVSCVGKTISGGLTSMNSYMLVYYLLCWFHRVYTLLAVLSICSVIHSG